MLKKGIIFIIFLLVLVALVFFTAQVRGIPANTEEPIGGQRDDYGCLTSAGYAFDEDIGACARGWELDDNQKRAATIVVDYIGGNYVTIVQVQTTDCLGCFTVELSQGEETQVSRTLTLANYEVVSMTPDDCTEQGGRAVTITGGVTCEAEELNLGEIVGFISPAICCK
ncbi:MAG: hypothetical protein GOV00_02920 [Candidatus Altiarchaeota archaeon]|nr:hypothetical protein [Candidatus Altiarchaeota archaeon]